MTNEEYEEAYTEALLIIREREEADQNEQPYINPDGRRTVSVADLLLDDHQVFEFAWGEAVAHRIHLERLGWIF